MTLFMVLLCVAQSFSASQAELERLRGHIAQGDCERAKSEAFASISVDTFVVTNEEGVPTMVAAANIGNATSGDKVTLDCDSDLVQTSNLRQWEVAVSSKSSNPPSLDTKDLAELISTWAHANHYGMEVVYGCYFQVKNIVGKKQVSTSCLQSLLEELTTKDGKLSCPAAACLVVRDHPIEDFYTMALGNDSFGVQQLTCKNYQIQEKSQKECADCPRDKKC